MFIIKRVRFSYFAGGLFALLCTGLAGCASIGSPGGGLYDETPPVLKNSDPAPGAIKVKKQKITMHFDENIKLDNALEKLTVSPPQEKSPKIQSNAKTLTIELLDSLKANTTYSIDLGDAVQDNNEGNPMEKLSMLFSTGDHIDSLMISGYLLNAADLEPITGAYVGIYRQDSILSDSILLTQSMERTGKTDELGAFHILGCAPGAYRIYALKDENTNYRYDMNSEDIAFLDSLVVPSMDSMCIVMMGFNEGKLTRYLDDCARPDSSRITVRFATHMDSLPQIAFMLSEGIDKPGDEVLIPEVNPTRDTLTYWIKDSLYYSCDSLNMILTYQFTDTTGFDIARTDTIQLLRPIVRTSTKEEKKPKEEKKKLNAKKRKSDKKEEAAQDSVPKREITYMQIKQIVGKSMEIGAKPVFETSAPLDSIDLAKLHLQYKKDTAWVEMPFQWVPDSLRPRRFTLLASPHYTPGYSYQLLVDSAAMYDIFGHPVDKTKMEFKEKTNEDYSHLLISIEGIHEPAFVELLNAKDQPVQRAKVVKNQAKFVHVAPGTYYARMIIDSNENGRFDAGNLFEHRQPEKVYYMNVELQLRSNWTIQQNWNPLELDLLVQKPETVKINKPKEKRERKSKNEEYLRQRGKN